jgi:hypothetical protein
MILSDREVRAAIERKIIGVTPCPPGNDKRWSATTLDLTLEQPGRELHGGEPQQERAGQREQQPGLPPARSSAGNRALATEPAASLLHAAKAGTKGSAPRSVLVAPANALGAATLCLDMDVRQSSRSGLC